MILVENPTGFYETNRQIMQFAVKMLYYFCIIAVKILKKFKTAICNFTFFDFLIYSDIIFFLLIFKIWNKTTSYFTPLLRAM